MGESAVLFPSYSFAAPLPHNQSHEENPIHALSQSVSFGRFMTENLEWGKWSSFSHKKYVDEAEKFSQPGSVAQKKAFFEAHYKRIADAKKAKASDESSNSDPKQQQQQPESVAVLLNTLETLTKDEVKDEESGETELVLGSKESVLSIGKDVEEEEEDSAVVDKPAVVYDLGKIGVVLEEEEDTSADKPVVADEFGKSGVVLKQEDDMIVPNEMEVKVKHTDDGELLKKSPSVGEKEEERRSITKSSSVLISPMEKSATSEAPVKAKELVFPQKISERPITHSSVKKNKNQVRQRFSFLKCLMGNTKTQDQNKTMKKRKTDKKPNKSFLCLCFKPEMVRETETPIRTQRKNL